MPRFSFAFSLLAALCVLPFLVLAYYSHPALDDLSISCFLRTVSLPSYVWNIYFTYSGRFSSSLFSGIHLLFNAQPSWYPYLIFFLVSTFALSLLAAATALVPVLVRGRGLVGSLVLVLGFSGFPWPAEGLFWLTGAVAYLLPLSLGCCLLALLARGYTGLTTRPMHVLWLLSAVLGFLTAGFSEVGALLLLLVGGTLVGLPSLRPRQLAAYWVVAATAVGCLLTLAAPGNFLRLSHRAGGFQIGHSAVLAAVGAGYLLLNWLGSGLLLVLTALLVPVSQRIAHYPGRSLLNRLTAGPGWLWPTLLLAGLFGATWFCYLAQGGIGPALRVKNLLYFYFLASWLLSVHAAVRRYAPPEWPRFPVPLVLRAALGLLVSCLFLSDHNTSLRHGSIGGAPNTVVQAYRDWLSGDAARYSAALDARYRLLRTTQQDSVALPELPVLPQTLFYYDISYNPNLWGNRTYALFFHKKAVWIYPIPALVH